MDLLIDKLLTTPLGTVPNYLGFLLSLELEEVKYNEKFWVFLMFIYFEREKERDAERGGERKLQAGCVLSAQSPV